MLELIFKDKEGKDHVIIMEHSLLSISKWEEVFKKPFLKPNYKLENYEKLYYYDCMIIESDFKLSDIMMSNDISNKVKVDFEMLIQEYLLDSRTATTIKKKDGEISTTTLTSEVLYAYIATTGLDISSEKWNINRLLMAIAVIGELNRPKEERKMSYDERIMMQSKLNDERRKKMKSKG